MTIYPKLEVSVVLVFFILKCNLNQIQNYKCRDKYKQYSYQLIFLVIC